MEPTEAGSVAGFDWDEGNRATCGRHGVPLDDIEFVLRQPDLRTWRDSGHSDQEERVQSFARDRAGRSVFVVFTRRHLSGRMLIRPISARYMHRREVDGYEEDTSNASNRPGG